MWVRKIRLLEKTEGITAVTERMTAKTEGKATTEDLP
jgi:hypothetical protein